MVNGSDCGLRMWSMSCGEGAFSGSQGDHTGPTKDGGDWATRLQIRCVDHGSVLGALLVAISYLL